MAHDNAAHGYETENLQDRWNVPSTATHIYIYIHFLPLDPVSLSTHPSGHSVNLDFSLTGAHPRTTLSAEGRMGACLGPSRGLGARPGWPGRVIRWPWACCPAPTPLGGQNRRKHGLTLVHHRPGAIEDDHEVCTDGAPSRVRQLKVNSFRLVDWRLARIVEGGEVRIIGRVAGFDVHRGGDEISRATIKAWIIYCGMSRVSSVLALAFFFFFFFLVLFFVGGGWCEWKYWYTSGHVVGIGVFWNWIWELVFGKVKNGEFFLKNGIFNG